MYKITYSESANVPIAIFKFDNSWNVNDLFIKFNDMGVALFEQVSKDGKFKDDDIPSLLLSIKESNDVKNVLSIAFSVKSNLKGSNLEVITYSDQDNSNLDFILNNTFAEGSAYKAKLEKKKAFGIKNIGIQDEKNGFNVLEMNVSADALKDTKKVNEFGENQFQETFRHLMFSLAGVLNS